MTLSPEELRRAQEIADSFPPYSEEQRRQIRRILWGAAPAPASETPAESPEAA